MDEGASRRVTIGVQSIDQVKARWTEVSRTGVPQGSHISFPTLELMWKILGPKRIDILNAMTGQGPIAIREVARRMGRDVKAVHGDVQGLLKAGLIEKTDEGRVMFPYDEIHVDFVLRGVAVA